VRFGGPRGSATNAPDWLIAGDILPIQYRDEVPTSLALAPIGKPVGAIFFAVKSGLVLSSYALEWKDRGL
jgi:hypothetical protein